MDKAKQEAVREMLDRYAKTIQEEADRLGIPFDGCVVSIIWSGSEGDNSFDGAVSVRAKKDEEEHQILHDVSHMIGDIIDREHRSGKSH